MRLWRKATGAFKDRCSIWAAKLSNQGTSRNPDLETVIIKATSHDDQCIDYKSIQKVFQWLRHSPLYLKPLLYTLSIRMEKTHSWVVALKGLMLIHGVFCFDLPTVQRMGRLPFDLSHFCDAHLPADKAWGYNTFVRAYYSYLDQKSSYACAEAKKLNRQGKKNTEETLMEELENLERLQAMIDAIMQVKPRHKHMNVVLVLEAMDCVIEEVLEVYEKFCKGIERVISRICYIGGKVEAGVGLGIARKAEVQGDKLASYLDFCKEIGVLSTPDCPKIMRVAEKDIDELRRVMSGESEKKSGCDDVGGVENEEKAIVVRNCCNAIVAATTDSSRLQTVITDKWEVFDDDVVGNGIAATASNPFVDCYSLVPYDPRQNHHVLPDLISF